MIKHFKRTINGFYNASVLVQYINNTLAIVQQRVLPWPMSGRRQLVTIVLQLSIAIYTVVKNY